MKIIQINSDYKVGSTGKITAFLHKKLCDSGYDSTVIYGRDSGCNEENAIPTISVRQSKFQHLLCAVSGNPYAFCGRSTKKIIALLKKEKPDIVHLQCINGYFVNNYKLLKWLGSHGIKTVLTLHAEYMYTGGCDHAFECDKWLTGCKGSCAHPKTYFHFFSSKNEKVFKCFSDSFKTFQRDNLFVVSVSEWLQNRAERSPILNRFPHCCIKNGINTKVYKYYPDAVAVRQRFVSDKELLILHVTAGFFPDEDDNKGGRYIVGLAKMLADNNVPARILVVANHFGSSAALPENLTVFGKTTDQIELAKLYSASDVTVIASKRETYSMPTAESLCCGTPVIGFQAGGPESIALRKYSRFVTYGDINALFNCLNEVVDASYDAKHISQAARDLYSSEKMVSEYTRIYDELEK